VNKHHSKPVRRSVYDQARTRFKRYAAGLSAVFEADAAVIVGRRGVTARRRELGLERLATVGHFLEWHDAGCVRWDQWHRECRWRQGERCPERPSLMVFAGNLRRRGAGPGYEALRRWVQRYVAGGPLALIDSRGRPCGPTGVDAGLWHRLARGVAAGRAVAELDRELRPVAKEGNLRWLSLGTLQARIRPLRRFLRRNGGLFGAGKPTGES